MRGSVVVPAPVPVNGRDSRLYEPSEIISAGDVVSRVETTVDGLSLHVYRVWFYGPCGIHQDKVDELARQLEYLNDVLETHNG